MATIGSGGVGVSSITVYVYQLDINYGGNDRTIEWIVSGGGQTFYQVAALGAQVSSGGITTFTGLTPGTAYTVSAIIHYANNTATSTPAAILVTTNPFYATISMAFLGSTTTSITLRVSNMATTTGCAPKYIAVYATANGQTYVNYATVTTVATTSVDVTLSGLPSGTTFSVSASIDYTGYITNGIIPAWASSAVYNIAAYTLNARPDKFYWTYPKEAGYAQTANMPAAEWNRFRQNVIDVMAYLGYSVSPSIAVAGQQVSRSHYNSIVQALQTAGYGWTLSTVSAGSPVSASALNALLQTVNNIP